MVQRISSHRSQASRQTQRSEEGSEAQSEDVVVIRKPKQLPNDIRCGVCGQKFSTCESCSEHMKRHHWDRLDSPRRPRTASTMATGLPPNGHAPCPPSPLPRLTMTPFTSTPRLQTAHEAMEEARKAANATNVPEYAGDIRRSRSEPFAGRRKGKPQARGAARATSDSKSAEDALFVRPREAAAGAAAAASPTSPRSPSTKKLHVCFECQGEFDDALSLTRHSRTHGAAKPYSCTRCGRTFALYSSLMNHERTHSPGRGPEFKCSSCSASFLHEASLKAHQRKHNDERTGGRARKPYQCNACDEWLSNEGALKIHMQRHEGFEAPRVCSLCGTNFSCEAFLRAHGKLHDGEAVTRCVICVRPFRRSRVLLRHSDVHAEERRNVCLLCEQRFPKVGDGSWRRMQLLLPQERRFQCLYCGASFPRLSQLAAHETGHTDPLPQAAPAAPVVRTRQQQQHHHHQQQQGLVHFPVVTVN